MFGRRHSRAKLDQDIPFELRALEAALAAGVTVLELAVGNLERAAFPALEALLKSVSVDNAALLFNSISQNLYVLRLHC